MNALRRGFENEKICLQIIKMVKFSQNVVVHVINHSILLISTIC